MIFGIDIAKRYEGLEIVLTRVETTSDNLTFLNNDIVATVILENKENIIDYIDDGDCITLAGNAGTHNENHIVKVSIKENMMYFNPTSTFLKTLPIKQVALKDIKKVRIINKILFAISTKTKEDLRFVKVPDIN